MCDFIKIDRLVEDDFTKIIENAGGYRFSKDDSREKNLNADYVFENAIVELKLVEEEGLEKETRQLKLSLLFSGYENSPVIVLDPLILSDEDRRKYFNIMEGLIKTHVKKASKQLKSTCINIGKETKKILLIVNNGYSALDAEEFKQVVKKCVNNDSSNIDYVICCGIYYYSDGFDSYVIAPFELEKITSSIEPPEYDQILHYWSCFLNHHMSRFIVEPQRRKNARLPVLDLEFEVEGKTFVKPPPPFGTKSEYWAAGRPRINSSGIDEWPPVAMTFPKLSRHSWNLVKNTILDAWELQDSYEEWIRFFLSEEKEYKNKLQPLVPIYMGFEEIASQVDNDYIGNFSDLCNFANEKFNKLVKEIILSARNINKTKVVLMSYVYLVSREIGRDKKNDLSSIYLVRGSDNSKITVKLVENKQMLFEHGLSLAAAYALKNSVDVVLYHKDTKYGWI